MKWHCSSCNLLLIIQPTRSATPEAQMPSGSCCGTALCWGIAPKEFPRLGQQCFGTQHFSCRRELAERLISCSYGLLLKLPIMWKCVKLKSFICLLSFCNAPSSQDLHMFIILNAFYEILMSTSEMRNDEAVLFIIIIKKISQKWVLFPPDFGSLLCTTPGLRPREWLTAVEHSWKCRKWGKKKDTSGTELAFLRESLFSTWYR